MRSSLFFPASVLEAEHALLNADYDRLAELDHSGFIRIWCSVVYLNPGLHTDNYHDPDYSCDAVVRSVLAEVWRRADAGEMSDDEMYPAEVIRRRLVA